VIDVLSRAEELVRAAVEDFEPATYDGATARRIAGLFGSIEKIAAAGRTLAWGRVESSGDWRRSGARSAAHEMASETGTSVGQAMAALRAAEQLESLDQAASAFRSGELSVAQVAEVASAATEAPDTQADLIDVARKEGLGRLRQEAARVRAAADAQSARQRYERVHRSRFARFYEDADGGCRLEARMTADRMAQIKAAMEAEASGLFETARKAGRRESKGAYLADALFNLVTAESGTGNTGRARVDGPGGCHCPRAGIGGAG
jgi:hypothetical protein